MVTFGSLYAGVGGIDRGLELAGLTPLWANEQDKYTCMTYRANHPVAQLIEGDIFDLDIEKLPPVDVLAGGFPCQPFSIAGNQMGFDDARGHHFIKIMDFVDILKPEVILLENVGNITSHNNGNTISVIIDNITGRGYYPYTSILNTKTHANIPQNRRRWFLVAFKENRLFQFPARIPLTVNFRDVLEQDVDDVFFYTPETHKTSYPVISSGVTRADRVYVNRGSTMREIKSGVCPTLKANMGTAGNTVPIILDGDRYRKLTPLECFRFQGFSDIILPDGLSSAQLYKQAGNSVTVPLIQRIGEQILKALNNDGEPIAVHQKQLF